MVRLPRAREWRQMRFHLCSSSGDVLQWEPVEGSGRVVECRLYRWYRISQQQRPTRMHRQLRLVSKNVRKRPLNGPWPARTDGLLAENSYRVSIDSRRRGCAGVEST